MSRRALITGAAGFVGQRLAARLREADWEVLCADYSSGGDLVCDITRPEEVRRMLEDAGRLDQVFHLAAQTFVPSAIHDPTRTFSVNLNGTVHLLHALRDLGSKAKALVVSSGEIYGPPQHLPVDESHPVNPQNPYAISKCAADQFAQYFANASDAPVSVVRPFNHSGPGQAEHFVLSTFARQVAEIEAGQAEPVVHVGNLDAERDFSHVDDVIDAYVLLADHANPGESYNVCSEAPRRVGDALEYLISRAELDIKIEQDPERMRPVDVPVVAGSAQRLKAATGWRPQRTFEQLLDELLDHWRARGEAAQA